MAKSMEIGGHGGHIKMDVQGYERPETSDEDDANWLVAQCKVAAAEFSCILKLSLVTRDFVEFLAQLEKAVDSLNGAATFTTLEEGLHIEIKFNHAGHADLFGRARSQTSMVPEQSVLSFSFETDQSFLAQTVRELKGIVMQFPIRKPSAPT
jgi:hypothetical protein